MPRLSILRCYIRPMVASRKLRVRILGVCLLLGSALLDNWAYSIRSPQPNVASHQTIYIATHRGFGAGYVTPLMHMIDQWYIIGALAGVTIFVFAGHIEEKSSSGL